MWIKNVHFEMESVTIKMAVVALLTAGWTSTYLAWRSSGGGGELITKISKPFQVSESLMAEVQGFKNGALPLVSGKSTSSIVAGAPRSAALNPSSNMDSAGVANSAADDDNLAKVVLNYADVRSLRDVAKRLGDKIGESAVVELNVDGLQGLQIDGWRLLITEKRVRMSQERSSHVAAALARLGQLNKSVTLVVEKSADVSADYAGKFEQYWAAYYGREIKSHVLDVGENILRLRAEVRR